MYQENPFDERPPIDQIKIAGVLYRVGGRIRIWPRSDADILDMALRGKTATIVSIEQDFEDRVHLAVTVDDDPGRDLGMTGLPGHRFFLRPGDVEPLNYEAG
jgi:hypothetical protein